MVAQRMMALVLAGWASTDSVVVECGCLVCCSVGVGDWP